MENKAGGRQGRGALCGTTRTTRSPTRSTGSAVSIGQPVHRVQGKLSWGLSGTTCGKATWVPSDGRTGGAEGVMPRAERMNKSCTGQGVVGRAGREQSRPGAQLQSIKHAEGNRGQCGEGGEVEALPQRGRALPAPHTGLLAWTTEDIDHGEREVMMRIPT
jgi:hypothetical protein